MQTPVPPQMIACMRLLRARGMTHPDIGRELGCNASTVALYAGDIKVARPQKLTRPVIERCRRESGLGSYRRNRYPSDAEIELLRQGGYPAQWLPLTSTEAARIQALAAQNLTMEAVARHMGVTRHQVRRHGRGLFPVYPIWDHRKSPDCGENVLTAGMAVGRIVPGR